MAHPSQTAIRGVFSVATINVLARPLRYGKHILITAYVGLNASLDAYYVAISILSVFVLTFGDVFDSLGIPRLVRTLQEEGEEAFRSFAGSIVMFAFVLSAILAGLLVLIAPWSTWIAPGFTPDKKHLVLNNIYLLLPMALVYLPYHAIGSVLRSRRRFKDFYLGEIVIATTTLGALWFGRGYPNIVPVSTSIGYGAVLVYILLAGAREFRLSREVFDPRMRQISASLLRLLPIYLTSYLFVVVDRGLGHAASRLRGAEPDRAGFRLPIFRPLRRGCRLLSGARGPAAVAGARPSARAPAPGRHRTGGDAGE